MSASTVDSAGIVEPVAVSRDPRDLGGPVIAAEDEREQLPQVEQLPQKSDIPQVLDDVAAFVEQIEQELGREHIPQASQTHIPQGWRWQKKGHGKYAGRYYEWVKGSGKNREYRKGGILAGAVLPTRPGKGNRTRGEYRKRH